VNVTMAPPVPSICSRFQVNDIRGTPTPWWRRNDAEIAQDSDSEKTNSGKGGVAKVASERT
jgi:hypothetical protein